MRIIFWLAAGLGAAAISAAAPAKPGAAMFHGSPKAGGPGGGHHAGDGLHFRFAPGSAAAGQRHGRRYHGFGRHKPDRFIGYGGGIVGPVGAVDPYGNGFFNGGGGRIRLRGDRPHFEYDRAYPYEWTSSATGPGGWEEEDAPVSRRPERCTMESGVRVCRGW